MNKTKLFDPDKIDSVNEQMGNIQKYNRSSTFENCSKEQLIDFIRKDVSIRSSLNSIESRMEAFHTKKYYTREQLSEIVDYLIWKVRTFDHTFEFRWCEYAALLEHESISAGINNTERRRNDEKKKLEDMIWRKKQQEKEDAILEERRLKAKATRERNLAAKKEFIDFNKVNE